MNMEFNIDPHTITKVAKRLKVEPQNINYEARNFVAKYWLYDEEGNEVEEGTKTIDIQYIDFLKQDPIDIPTFNLLLANWGLVAIEQTTAQPPVI